MRKYVPSSPGSAGGGDVEHWQALISTELDGAHDFYSTQAEALEAELRKARAEIERLKTPIRYLNPLCPGLRYETIEDTVSDDNVGEIVEVVPVLATIYVLVDLGNDHSVHKTRIEAEGARGETERDYD